jgi:hypothetical protein
MHVVSNSYGMYCPEALQRMYYYPAPVYSGGNWGYYTPYLWFDGQKGGTGYTGWQAYIADRLDQPAPVTITMWGTWSRTQSTGTIYAQFRNDSTETLNGSVYFVVTEDSIYRVVPNGDQWHNHVARDYLPNHLGESVSIPAGDSVTLSREFTLDSAWDASMIEFVTWIQNPIMQPEDSTKEIWQGATLDVDEIGIEEYVSHQIIPSQILPIPNPCVDGTRFSFTLPAGDRYSVTFYDVSGRMVQTLGGIASGNDETIEWNLRDERGIRVNAGVYLYRFESTHISTSGKVVVR